MKQFKVDMVLIRQDGERVVLKLEEFTTAAGIMTAVGARLGQVTDGEDWPKEEVVIDIPELVAKTCARHDTAYDAIVDLTDAEQDEELSQQTLQSDVNLEDATDMPAQEEAGQSLADKIQRDN